MRGAFSSLWTMNIEFSPREMFRRFDRSEVAHTQLATSIYSSTRHGDAEFQRSSACRAHAVVLSLWHDVHGFGIP